MNPSQPFVSIVIPTCNRKRSLLRTLDALRTQTYPAHRFEVLVVADGCSDGTAATLSGYPASYRLRALNQLREGASAARNAGAMQADGPLLLFLDDDVEPTTGLVAGHVTAHLGHADRVVIGPYPSARGGRLDAVNTLSRAWWNDRFQTMRRPDHRFSYRDCLSGNLSLHRDLFLAVGRFDAHFTRAHEDQELGARLIQAKARFCFTPEALAFHHEYESLTTRRSFTRAFDEGRADVLLGLRHPELRITLPLIHYRQAKGNFDRLVHGLAEQWPSGGDLAAGLLSRALTMLERLRVYDRWRRLYQGLRHYWYLRGVWDALGGPHDFSAYLDGGPARADQWGEEIELDLSEGLLQAEERVDRERPAGVRLRYGRHVIGRIAGCPGFEPLRGVHLRPSLATDHAWRFLTALAWHSGTLQLQTIELKRPTTPILTLPIAAPSTPTESVAYAQQAC